MIKGLVIVFTALIASSYGQYLRQQHWARPALRGNIGYGGNVGYNGWAQPRYAGGYTGGYRAAVVAPPVAYGGGYTGGYRGGYGGAYVAPHVAGVVAPPVAGPVAVARPQYYGGRYEDESYKPYSFGYSTTDEYGTQMGRQEAADGSGNVRGSYSYKDPAGQFRQVEYVADAGGFRAEVNTNEAGVVSHRPADVVYNVHHK